MLPRGIHLRLREESACPALRLLGNTSWEPTKADVPLQLHWIQPHAIGGRNRSSYQVASPPGILLRPHQANAAGRHADRMHNVSIGDEEILRAEVGSGVHGMTIAGTDDHDEMGFTSLTPSSCLGWPPTRATGCGGPSPWETLWSRRHRFGDALPAHVHEARCCRESDCAIAAACPRSSCHVRERVGHRAAGVDPQNRLQGPRSALPGISGRTAGADDRRWTSVSCPQSSRVGGEVRAWHQTRISCPAPWSSGY